jgi:FAD/FMN-containing dehydrogenase
VIDTPAILDEYAQDYSLMTPRKPLLIVKPETTKEVQEIVQISNEYKIPMVPRSSSIGFLGAAIPSEGGIVVDLSRMDKIIDLDVRNNLVRFEPGVTWEKLQTELAKHDRMALIPLLPHPKKSALTSHLEREKSLIPRQEYKEPLYAVEVVSPTGEIIRTGTADIPQTENKVHMPHPLRPITINWRRVVQGAQGTLGIVTWGVAKIEFLPTQQKVYFMPFQNLDEATEAVYRILRRVIGNECLLLNDFDLALIIASLMGKAKEDVEKLRESLPPFTLILFSTGGTRLPEERIGYEKEALMEIALETGFEVLPTVAGITGLDKLLVTALRKPWPQNQKYWKFNFKGLNKDVFFLTTLDKTAQLTEALYQVADKHKYPAQEVGIYIQPLEQGRACYVEYGLQLNPDDPEEVERMTQFWKETCETLMAKGAYFSRPYGPLAPIVYSRCGAFYNTLKRVKEVFDPNRVMNPGKLGL